MALAHTVSDLCRCRHGNFFCEWRHNCVLVVQPTLHRINMSHGHETKRPEGGNPIRDWQSNLQRQDHRTVSRWTLLCSCLDICTSICVGTCTSMLMYTCFETRLTARVPIHTSAHMRKPLFVHVHVTAAFCAHDHAHFCAHCLYTYTGPCLVAWSCMHAASGPDWCCADTLIRTVSVVRYPRSLASSQT